MGEHGDWYPSTRHVFAVWLIWASIIVCVVMAITGTVPLREYDDNATGNSGISASSGTTRYTGNRSRENQYVTVGDGLLLSHSQRARRIRKSPYLAPRIGWPRQTEESSSDLLQRSFRHSQAPTDNDPVRDSEDSTEHPSGVRTESPIPSRTGFPGGSTPNPSDVPFATCTGEGMDVIPDVLSGSQNPSPVPTYQEDSTIPVEDVLELPTVQGTTSLPSISSTES